jgi:hypothetical protein
MKKLLVICLSLSFFWLPMLIGCSEKVVVPTALPAYNWTTPEGPDYAANRIADIKEAVRGIENERIKSLYWMEAGLIYEKILKMDQDSIYCYEQSVKADPGNCDAQLLLSAVLSRARRDEASVKAAQQILESMKDCGEGTLLVFNRAKLDIVTGDAQAVNRGRKELERLSTYNLGQSGVRNDEIINLLIYSYLKEKNFSAASKRFGESPNEKIIPKLGALMYMGNLEFDKLSGFTPAEKGEIKEFLLGGDRSAYFAPTAMERLVLTSPEQVGTLEKAPEPPEGMTKFERDIFTDTWGRDKELIDLRLEERSQKIAEIKKAQKALKEAKEYLMTTELDHYLLGKPRPGDAYQKYVKAHTSLRRAILSLSEPLQKILSTGDPKQMLKNPDVILEDSELLDKFMATEGEAPSDKELVSDLFQSFAYKKVESLRAIDFFLPFTVRMEDLTSPGSREVKGNIARLQQVITGQPVSQGPPPAKKQ